MERRRPATLSPRAALLPRLARDARPALAGRDHAGVVAARRVAGTLRTAGAGCSESVRRNRALPLRAIALLVIVVSVNGCATLSGEVLRNSREEFNETAQISNAQQLLLNIVRLRYGSSPYFLELTTVSTSASMAGALGVSGSSAAAAIGLSPNVVISPSISVSQTPSFVFQPLAGEKLGRQLLRPVDLRTIALLHTAGWGLREILLLLVDNINGVPNAPTLTQFAPTESSNNDRFKRVAALFEHLQEMGVLQLGVDAPATPAAPGTDIVLSLQIDRAAASLPEVQELIRLLSLDPASLKYQLAAAVSGGGGRNIAIKPRSILAAMRYLSKGIEIPDADARDALVPRLPRATGPGSADRSALLLKDVMRIASSDIEPTGAYIRVFYQRHWFYIGQSDLVSKQSLALLETAYALQAGEIPPIRTILTLPISR